MVGAHRDEVAARRLPSQLDGGRRGSRSVLGELDHVGRRNHVEESLGTVEFDGGGAGEVGAQLERGPHGVDHGGKGVPEPDGTQTHAVLDELVAVGIPDTTARSPGEHSRRQCGKLVGALGIGVAATGHEVSEPVAERSRVVEGHVSPHVGILGTRRDRRLDAMCARCHLRRQDARLLE